MDRRLASDARRSRALPALEPGHRWPTAWGRRAGGGEISMTNVDPGRHLLREEPGGLACAPVRLRLSVRIRVSRGERTPAAATQARANMSPSFTGPATTAGVAGSLFDQSDLGLDEHRCARLRLAKRPSEHTVLQAKAAVRGGATDRGRLVRPVDGDGSSLHPVPEHVRVGRDPDRPRAPRPRRISRNETLVDVEPPGRRGCPRRPDGHGCA